MKLRRALGQSSSELGCTAWVAGYSHCFCSGISNTLSVLKEEITRQKRQLEKEYAPVAGSLNGTFKSLGSRALTQQIVLWVIDGVVVAGLLLTGPTRVGPLMHVGLHLVLGPDAIGSPPAAAKTIYQANSQHADGRRSANTATREVQRLLGRCRSGSQYERLIKAIVAHHDISGPAHALEALSSAYQ